MTAAAHVLAPALGKELRALLPTYCAVLVAVVVGSFSNSYTLIAAGLLGFAFGSVALGAQSFGHEYSHRTLGLLLSQPLDRRRLFVYKLAVLSVMLITLTGTTLVMYQELLRRAASPHTEPSMLVLAAACGLFMAPCLTMLCRNTLAAAVFTIAIPGLLSTGADIAGGIIYGLQNAAAIDRCRFVVFWPGMFLICAAAAIGGWRMFQRLEVIEGHGADVQFPESLGAGSESAVGAPARRQHPVWTLVKKDLRLQQITFVVASLFVCVWLGLAWMERTRPDSPTVPLISLTVLYAGILAMLTGSLASAEERHLGTVEWQMLLPMAAWRQWAVKVGVVGGIVAVLGVALPALLGLVIPVRGDDVAADGREPVSLFALQERRRCAGAVVSKCCRDSPVCPDRRITAVARVAVLGLRSAVPRPCQRLLPADRGGRGLRGAAAPARLPQSPNGGSECGSYCQAGAVHRRLRCDRAGRADPAGSVIASIEARPRGD
jgi:hypothetical protein